PTDERQWTERHPPQERQAPRVGPLRPHSHPPSPATATATCPNRAQAITPPSAERQPTHEQHPTHVGDLRSHPEPPSPRRAEPTRLPDGAQTITPPSAERQPTHEQHPTHVGTTARLPRATQTIPPAVRRHVLHRDHGRCVVPGCAHGSYLDVHHLRARAEGGTHEPDNLVTLCAGHHAALHAGRLSIEG